MYFQLAALFGLLLSMPHASAATITGTDHWDITYNEPFLTAKGNSSLTLHPEGYVAHLSLYEDSQAIILGGKISHLNVFDTASVSIADEADVSWLNVGHNATAHIYGTDFSFSAGHLNGIWGNQTPFSFWLIPINEQGNRVYGAALLPSNVQLHDTTVVPLPPAGYLLGVAVLGIFSLARVNTPTRCITKATKTALK